MGVILNDYQCERCGVFEELTEAPAPDSLPCKCGRRARRMFPLVGGIVDEHPAWLDSSARHLGCLAKTRSELTAEMDRRGVMFSDQARVVAGDAKNHKRQRREQTHQEAVDKIIKKTVLEVRG